jgi:hypothetical protein
MLSQILYWLFEFKKLKKIMNIYPKEFFETIELLFEEDLEEEVCKITESITIPKEKLTEIEMNQLGKVSFENFIMNMDSKRKCIY